MEFKISNYGQERDLVCTEQEREIFNIIVQICKDAGLDTSMLFLVRKSDDYVSAVMRANNNYGDMDVARIKYTPRAKWIKTHPRFEKVKLSSPDDVWNQSENIVSIYHFNEPYL